MRKMVIRFFIMNLCMQKSTELIVFIFNRFVIKDIDKFQQKEEKIPLPMLEKQNLTVTIGFLHLKSLTKTLAEKRPCVYSYGKR